MPRLIDADALMEEFKNDKIWYKGNAIRGFISNAPTIQREGWVSVPIEPTEEMLRAVMAERGETDSLEDWKLIGYAEDAIADYKAMIQAVEPTDNF